MKYKTKRTLVVLLRPIRKTKHMLVPKEPPLSTIQLWALRVTKACIRHPKSELLIDPITGVRYARYNGYKIKFGNNFIYIKRKYKVGSEPAQNISNYIELNYISGEKLITFFNLKVSERRQIMDQEDDQDTMDNLSQMHQSLIARLDKETEIE